MFTTYKRNKRTEYTYGTLVEHDFNFIVITKDNKQYLVDKDSILWKSGDRTCYCFNGDSLNNKLVKFIPDPTTNYKNLYKHRNKDEVKGIIKDNIFYVKGS